MPARGAAGSGPPPGLSPEDPQEATVPGASAPVGRCPATLVRKCPECHSARKDTEQARGPCCLGHRLCSARSAVCPEDGVRVLQGRAWPTPREDGQAGRGGQCSAGPGRWWPPACCRRPHGSQHRVPRQDAFPTACSPVCPSLPPQRVPGGRGSALVPPQLAEHLEDSRDSAASRGAPARGAVPTHLLSRGRDFRSLGPWASSFPRLRPTRQPTAPPVATQKLSEPVSWCPPPHAGAPPRPLERCFPPRCFWLPLFPNI